MRSEGLGLLQVQVWEEIKCVCVSTSATFRKTRKAATNRLGLDILGEEGNKS